MIRWILIATVVGVLAGSASALLLAALDWATYTREAHLWLIALLPVAGFAVGWIYHYFGGSVERGNNLAGIQVFKRKGAHLGKSEQRLGRRHDPERGFRIYRATQYR